MTEEDKKILQETVLDVYNQFVEAVAKGRNLSIHYVKQYADGRVLTGRMAKKAGLIDELGEFGCYKYC